MLLKYGFSYSFNFLDASKDSAKFIKLRMCEKALVILKVFSGESFFTSFEIFEKTLLLFLSSNVFLDSNLSLSTILKKAGPS